MQRYRRTRKRKRRRGLCRGCLVGSSEAPTRCPTAFVWYFINTSANYFPFFVWPGRFRSWIGNAPYKLRVRALRVPSRPGPADTVSTRAAVDVKCVRWISFISPPIVSDCFPRHRRRLVNCGIPRVLLQIRRTRGRVPALLVLGAARLRRDTVPDQKLRPPIVFWGESWEWK